MCATLLPTGTNPADSLGLSQSVGLLPDGLSCSSFFQTVFQQVSTFFCDPLSSRHGLLGVTTSQALCVAIHLNRNNTIGDVVTTGLPCLCRGPFLRLPQQHHTTTAQHLAGAIGRRLPASWKEMCYAYDEPAATPPCSANWRDPVKRVVLMARLRLLRQRARFNNRNLIHKQTNKQHGTFVFP